MPTLRMLAGGAMSFGTPGRVDDDGLPTFAAREGDVQRLLLDWRGALGTDTIISATWEGESITVSGVVTGARETSALVTVPTNADAGLVRVVLTTAAGETRGATVRVEAIAA